MLPISIEQAWDFFSNPNNLQRITPPEMNFRILSDLGDGRAYAGQIINYKVSPVAGISIRWTTEISQCVDRQYFVDEQRFGPYSFWHHKHFFREVEGVVMMEDIVDYAMPFGLLGRLVHALFIRKKLESIFAYREQVMKEIFV